jgi:hypothetical protein
MSDEAFEKALRDSMRRQPAPQDFAAKVLEKAGHAKKTRTWLQRPLTFALAAAVAAIAIVPAVLVEHERREQERGLQAKRDLLTALAITRTQLQHAREKIQRTARVQ